MCDEIILGVSRNCRYHVASLSVDGSVTLHLSAYDAFSIGLSLVVVVVV